MDLARLAHPSHARRLRMRDRGRRLEWLFSRLTDAHLVLSDPDRAAGYRATGAEAPPGTAEPHERARRSERVSLARHNYRLALEHIDSKDFHYAIELLRQAVIADPLPQYYLLLGQILERNPRWLHMAVDSLREAVTLRPHDTHLRAELTRLTDEYRQRLADGDVEPPGDAGPAGKGDGLAGRLRRRFKGSEPATD